MNTSDWQEVMDRLDKIEKRLEEISKPKQEIDLQEIFNDLVNPKYMRSSYKTPCMLETLSCEDLMKPMGLYCPCPKCTPHSMSGGSIQSTSTGDWRNEH